MRKHLLFLLCIFLCIYTNSQSIYFPAAEHSDTATMARNMPALAKRVIAAYKNDDQETYLNNLFRFKLVAQEYQQSINMLDSLLVLYGADRNPTQKAIGIQFRAYALTMLRKPSANSFFEEYKKVLTELYITLPEVAQPTVAYYFDTDIKPLGLQLAGLWSKYLDKDSITLADAQILCRVYNSYNVYDKVLDAGKAVLAWDDEQYIIEDSVQIKTRDGATIAATVIRKRDVTAAQPAIFVFNIYTGPIDNLMAKEAAVNGYIGIVANTRGKRLSPEEIEPFEHDANDAYDIIDWISKQPWSNGKVGMYGGSYLGFAQWATVKKMHPALKTIIPQVAVGIGIDYPMYNNVFMGYMLQWIHYVTNNKQTDNADFGNTSHWDSISRKWYTSGQSFRSLDTLEGRPNKIFQRWLQHPSHDSYWQNMVAYQRDFAKINIPVLTITGYYDGDQAGAMYYFKEHYIHNKNPNHYLLIGPYDHGGAQRSPDATLRGYTIDSVAMIDINRITDQWFDYVMKDSSRPEILKDKINMQVMGANTWKHAPSLSRASNDTLTLHFSNIRSGNYYKLLTKKPVVNEFIRQEVDLAYRGDTTEAVAYKIIDSLMPIREQLAFISEPFDQPFMITGSFMGQLKAALNKKDFDFSIRLFELMLDGQFFNLSLMIGRASYAKNRSKRTLLRPGVVESVPFSQSLFTCKQLQKGSRLIVLLGINKNDGWQINYGTGKDVSDETIADAKEPLQMQWFNQSFIQIPVWR